jgi:hypothetical protein
MLYERSLPASPRLRVFSFLTAESVTDRIRRAAARNSRPSGVGACSSISPFEKLRFETVLRVSQAAAERRLTYVQRLGRLTKASMLGGDDCPSQVSKFRGHTPTPLRTCRLPSRIGDSHRPCGRQPRCSSKPRSSRCARCSLIFARPTTCVRSRNT